MLVQTILELFNKQKQTAFSCSCNVLSTITFYSAIRLTCLILLIISCLHSLFALSISLFNRLELKTMPSAKSASSCGSGQPALGPESCRHKCPACHANVMTSTKSVPGTLTWILCIVLVLIG